MAGMLAPLSGSFHIKARGTYGGVDAPLTPTDTMRPPSADKMGMAAWLMPGTSRCDSTVLRLHEDGRTWMGKPDESRPHNPHFC